MSGMDDELTPKGHKSLPVVPPGSHSLQHKLSLTFYYVTRPSHSFIYFILFLPPLSLHVCWIYHAMFLTLCKRLSLSESLVCFVNAKEQVATANSAVIVSYSSHSVEPSLLFFPLLQCWPYVVESYNWSSNTDLQVMVYRRNLKQEPMYL